MKTKKILSLLLSLLMIIAVIPMTALESTAASYYETESNDTYASADILSINAYIGGCINKSSDKDVYKITTPKNGKLSLLFNHKYAEKATGWNVTIYYYVNGEYKEIDKTYITTTAKETYKLTTIGAVSGGEYYIKINGTSSFSGESVVNHEYIIENAFSATEYYEKELNDSYNTATNIKLNKLYNGCITGKSDSKDIYRITTKEKGKLSFAFKHKYNEKSDAYWCMEIYQYLNGEYKKLDNAVIKLNYKETYEITTIDVLAGDVYYIKVYVPSSSSWGLVGYEYGIIASQKLPKPTPKVANKNGYVSITWSKSAGAKGYYVYRKGPNDKSWKRIGNVTGTSFKDKNVKSGTNYTYTVKAYNGSIYSSYHSGVAIKYLAQPTFKVANKSSYVSITWNKTAGAKGYYVYRKGPNDKKWVRIANVTGKSYSDKKVKRNVKYTYTVKAYNGSYNSSYHSGVTVKH